MEQFFKDNIQNIYIIFINIKIAYIYILKKQLTIIGIIRFILDNINVFRQKIYSCLYI